MLWSTEIPVSHVQVTEISCIDWNPWYFRAFINSYFLLGPEPQPAPDSPPPPSPARFEQPLSLHLTKYYLYCFWQPMGACSASVGRPQPLVGGRSWGLGWTRDVSDLEIQTKVRVIFHQQKSLQCTLNLILTPVQQTLKSLIGGMGANIIWWICCYLGFSSNAYYKKHVLNEMPFQHWKFRSPGAPKNWLKSIQVPDCSVMWTQYLALSFHLHCDIRSSPQNIVWRYIVKQLSDHFQNIV